MCRGILVLGTIGLCHSPFGFVSIGLIHRSAGLASPFAVDTVFHCCLETGVGVDHACCVPMLVVVRLVHTGFQLVLDTRLDRSSFCSLTAIHWYESVHH